MRPERAAAAGAAALAVLVGGVSLAIGLSPGQAKGVGVSDADPYALPDELLDAMRGSVCGDGDYPDPRDPASIPGFEAPKRVDPGRRPVSTRSTPRRSPPTDRR